MAAGSQNNQWNDDAHFSLANLPYGIVSTPANTQPRVATRLYGTIYVISDLIAQDLLPELPEPIAPAILDQPTLNALAALPRATTQVLRAALTHLLTSHVRGTLAPALSAKLTALGIPVATVTPHLPLAINDFSDFSCSRHHVLNAGEAVQGVRSLPPGFPYFPIGYTGRTSSIVVSGASVRRPWGMMRSREKEGAAVFLPSQAVDFELEVAAVVGQSTKLGEQVKVEDADDSIFGFVLLNDWSARDIQGFEMNPLGPLNGKSFGTTISPWVVPIEALAPFRCAPATPPEPTRAAYLQDSHPKPHYAVQLQVDLILGDGAEHGTTETVCRSRLEWLDFTFRDLVAHQTVNGCPLRTGDLLATGTISGSETGTVGCLLEATRGGKQSLPLSHGKSRKYLEDGDGVRLTGWAGEIGSETCVGFGEAYGILLPAHQ